MLCSKRNREDLEQLKELVSLQNQVKEVQFQDKFGEQNFHESVKKVFEPLTDTVKDTSRDISKTMKETSIKNEKALENLSKNFWKS